MTRCRRVWRNGSLAKSSRPRPVVATALIRSIQGCASRPASVSLTPAWPRASREKNAAAASATGSGDEGPDGGIIRVDAAQATDVFYGDVAPELAAEAVARLVPASYSSQTAPQSKAAWHEIPSTYVICTEDNALPASAQEAMARRAANVRRLPASHSPFLSMPVELAALLRAELAVGVNAN